MGKFAIKYSKATMAIALIAVICRQGGKHGASSTCQECKGRGVVIKVRQLGPGMVQQMRSECGVCNGEGFIVQQSITIGFSKNGFVTNVILL